MTNRPQPKWQRARRTNPSTTGPREFWVRVGPPVAQPTINIKSLRSDFKSCYTTNIIYMDSLVLIQRDIVELLPDFRFDDPPCLEVEWNS